jgi:putative toxin-antitoxin system antitoxin component (TIGR02293 family)
MEDHMRTSTKTGEPPVGSKRPSRATPGPLPLVSPRTASRRCDKASVAGTPDSALFIRLVGAEPLAGLAAVESIREGYSAGILKSVSRFFDVPDARIQAIAQVPASTASRLEKKQARIDPAATERIYRIGTVTRMAIEVFEDQASAISWMRQPNRALGNAAPLELMDTEPGAVSVRQVLNAIATGGAA